MDFTLNSEQQALADSVERFTARDYDFATRGALIATGGGFSRENWSRFAELGWLGAGLPEAAGGFGGGAIETMIIAERLGRALILEPLGPVAIHALQTLAAAPSTALRDDLVSSIITGERLVTVAHNEAPARGDVGFVEARYENGRISGAKSLALAAPLADRLIVSARGPAGVGLYLVDPCASGLKSVPYRLLDNSRAADLTFEGTPVEAELAAPPAAVAAIAAGCDQALVATCAEAVGVMDAAIAITREYLKTRRQFGAPLSSFQALQHRMADMLVELELSRSIVYQGVAALALSGAERARGLSAMKAIVSVAAMFVGRNAVQLHGGIGMTEENAIGHYYRRLFVIAAQSGDEAFHLRRMAANVRPFWPEPAAEAVA